MAIANYYKKSFISTLAEKISNLFKFKNYESETDKIANSFSPNIATIDERRELVRNFFTTKIKLLGTELVFHGKMLTVSYLDYIGREQSFTIGVDEYGLDKIVIGKHTIRPLRKTNGADYLDERIIRWAVKEYIFLIEFDKFVHSQAKDQHLINTLGRKIEKVVHRYNLNNFDEQYKAGLVLDKALLANCAYKQTKKSFEKAEKECERL